MKFLKKRAKLRAILTEVVSALEERSWTRECLSKLPTREEFLCDGDVIQKEIDILEVEGSEYNIGVLLSDGGFLNGTFPVCGNFIVNVKQ